MNLSGSTIYGDKNFSGNMVIGATVSGPTNVGFELILSLKGYYRYQMAFQIQYWLSGTPLAWLTNSIRFPPFH